MDKHVTPAFWIEFTFLTLTTGFSYKLSVKTRQSLNTRHPDARLPEIMHSIFLVFLLLFLFVKPTFPGNSGPKHILITGSMILQSCPIINFWNLSTDFYRHPLDIFLFVAILAPMACEMLGFPEDEWTMHPRANNHSLYHPKANASSDTFTQIKKGTLYHRLSRWRPFWIRRKQLWIITRM